MGSLIEPKRVEKEDAEGRDQLLGKKIHTHTHTEREGGERTLQKKKEEEEEKEERKVGGVSLFNGTGCCQPCVQTSCAVVIRSGPQGVVPSVTGC